MSQDKPLIFSSEKEAPSGAALIEAFESSLRELFFIRNPHLKKHTPESEESLKIFLNTHGIHPIWIFYPWLNTLIRTVPEDIYFELRTARNRNIITQEEQEKYRNAAVGIAGLSVGSSALCALAMGGGPKTIKIADFDTIEISNLNRMRAGLSDVGKNKTLVAAYNVWGLDPFADLAIWDQGVSRETIRDFILGTPRLDVFIDEMDSLDLKILSRLICREQKIPVLMATDNGDSIILDVERYDQEPDRAIFHGLVGDMKAEDVTNLTYKDWLVLATKIVGPDYLTERMQESLINIGKTIPAVPQLGTTAAIAGSSISYAVRRIVNGQDMPSGRYAIGLEEKLIPQYMNEENIQKRQEKTQEFINSFGKK